MLSCRIARFLYRVLPLEAWRSLLIRLHMDSCPLCRAGLASREEALRLLTSDSGMKDTDFLWPGIGRRLSQQPVRAGKPRFAWKPGWNSALTAAAVIAAAAWAVFLFRGFRPDPIQKTGPEAAGIRIVSLSVDGYPADAVYFQPRDSGMIIIWAEKAREGVISP